MAGMTAEELTAQIAALEKALTSGRKMVTYRSGAEERTVIYQSISDMRQALDYARSRLSELQGAPATGISVSVARFVE